MSSNNDEYYITYNLLISLCILSDDYDNSQNAKFLYAEENLEHSLNFKLCKKSFYDYSDIKGSLFYIRDIDECSSTSEKQENISKELDFLSKEKIHKNTSFYLQHMTSKKFISVEKTKDNRYILKLMKNINKAANFYLKKVNQKRNSREYMNINDIFNLSIYIEDEDLFYYLKDDINPIMNKSNNYGIIIDKNPTTNFYLINQKWCIQETKEIYSGQLINIIFSSNKKEDLMLSVIKEEHDENEKKDKYDEYILIGVPVTDELSLHVLYNSFWVIEEDDSCYEEIIKSPIEIKKYFRIHNLNIGLYLNIRLKKNNLFFDYNDFSKSEELSNKLFQFNLVDDEMLNTQFRFKYNFLFNNYSFDNLITEVVDNGEYILKGIYNQESNLNIFHKYIDYYKPISLSIYNKNNENRLDIKREDDFIFKIKKVDLHRGIQVTYVQKIIETLKKNVEENDIKNDSLINKSIKFFFEYLMNIDYSFRDEKYECNIPIKDRQILLLRFHVVELIDKSLEYYLNKIQKEKKNYLNDKKKKILSDLLNNIIKFFKNLSVDNEEIKQTIYIISLNKLLKLSDIIFCDNITDTASLLNFIFNLIDDSEALQDYFLGGGGILKSQIKDNKNLKEYNIDDLLREKRLFGYIEKSHNYLLYYEKLIRLNKIQYKRKEIESDVRLHIESLNKEDENVKTYKQIIKGIIKDLLKGIKTYAFLLDKFIKIKQKEKNNPLVKKRQTRSLFKKISVILNEEREKRLKEEIQEFKRRAKKKRTTTKESSNIIINEIDKIDTCNKLIDSEEENENDDVNINNEINTNINNEKEKEKENEEINEDRKDTNITLKKTFTIKDIFKKKKFGSVKFKESKNKEDSEYNRIKSEFVEPGVGEFKPKKDPKKLFRNYMSTIIKGKSKKLNENITDNSSSNMGRRNSVRPENVLPYNVYLAKLGEIVLFIKFFKALDLNKGLFIYEHFQELINEDLIRGGNLDNSLYIFFSGNAFEKGKNCFLDKNIVNLYLFHLYNSLFPNIKSSLKEKIENDNLNGNDIIDIIDEIDRVDIDEKDLPIYDDEVDYVKKMIADFDKMDDNLCILYSIYQFLINQYTKTVQKLFELKCNFFLNFLTKEDLNKSKDIFSDIIKNLLSKITFLNKNILPNLYEKFKSNPSLLSPEFDLDNYLLQYNNNGILNKTTIRNNRRNKIQEKFSRNEALLIEYLYYFLKKCDEIKYTYEKMIIYGYIKYLIDYEKYYYEKSESLKEVFIKEQLSIISQKINNQKLKILNFYQKSVDRNKKSSINSNQKEENKDEENNGEDKDKFMALKTKEKTEFITQLLRNYEIKKFFNNIIYMESKNSNIISDKALKKLRRIRGYFEEIQKEILMLKINFEKKNNDNEFDDNDSNKLSLQIINKNLGKICNEQGKLFHLEFIVKKNENRKLINMLIYENKSFYKKIQFTKIFDGMVKSITYFKNFKDKNILIYCSYLLKIFNDLKNKDSDFHRTIVKYYKLYANLIHRSLRCINGFEKRKITDEEPLFLNISYLAIEAFLILLKNSKLNFFKLKNFMEGIFSELRKVFYTFQNRKYKIIYQILYTFAVSRVLLFLNKQRICDSYTYDIFFNLIYPIEKMRENISFCFKTINNSLDKEHILSLRDAEIFIDENSISNEDETEENFSQYMQDDNKENLIMNDPGDKIIPMDLSFVHQKKEKESFHQKQNVNKKEKENEMNISVDYIRWEDENEIQRLSFYLNYLSVYVIYLNDKNTLMKDNKDDEFKKKEIKEKTSFSFNTLSGKIKVLLDTGTHVEDIIKKENLDSNQLMINQLDNTLIKEEKNFFGENLNSQNIDYKFFSVLLESILVYRANLNGQNIEIQIKKAKENKDEEKKLNLDNENEKLIKDDEEDELLINKNDNDNIIFYYYDSEYIDIILLEKILNEVELKEDITSYCLEDSHTDKANSNFLNELFKDQKAYRIIQSYYDEEYNLIHNYFIKNIMELLITKTLKSFSSNDFIKISEMENYFYKRMGEIYSNTKINNDILLKKNSLVDFLILNEQNINTNLKEINLLSFFDSLVYIYQKFKKSICIIYYKIGFELLIDKCFTLFKQEDDKENKITDKFDLESMTNTLILLFSSKINKEILKDKKIFPIMLSGIETLLLYILSEGTDFIYKNIELLKEYFLKLNFIFENLSEEFEKIVYFMKKPSKTKDLNKFTKKVIKLQNILDFLLIFLEYKKLNEDILTEEISKFTGKVIENVIKLLYILLELPNRTNFVAIDLLIEFLFNFIKGPDILNLNLLFSLGFFDLVIYVIRDIDYYNIFLNYLNKDNLYEVIDYYATAECKILKIFIIYYNLSHEKNNIEQFEKLQHWYEDNFDLIKKKLKRLYYMSKKEMDKKEYNVDKMLLFFNKDDEYSEYELGRREGLSDSKKNKYEEYINKMVKMDKYKNIEDNITSEKENNKYCIIKFDLLLVYYSLYNYHIDLSTKKTELNISKKNILYRFLLFIFNILFLIFRIITIEFYIIYFIFTKLSIKKKTDVDLLQDLKNIKNESQIMDEQQIIDFLKKYIKELEISLKNIIYKVYFPMLNKAKTIENYKDEYYKVEQIDSSDFINYLLSNYDSIHIRAKEYVLINKIINLPILNVFFNNLDTLANVVILFSLIINLIIMLSYNNYITSCDGEEDFRFRRKKNYVRLNCPYLLYKKKYKSSVVLEILKIFGICELILQTIIFIDYIVRIFSVEQAKIKLKYRTKNLKKKFKKKEKSKRDIIFISLEVLYQCIVNFRSLYYILSLIFICFGLAIHPFFYCITLLEFVNRVQLMQTVLKAMYKPIANILITLLMFIILEYLFSLFAVSYFTYHFPNLTDTKNFLKTFMRTIDQTFKQDGGVGTYLQKSLQPEYTAYTVSSYFNVRFFYDLLFYLLILSLIFQLFLSTIIDYFNETRENDENFKEGLETNCSVCGMEREDIEKIYNNNKNSFEKHITYFHNAFNYIYYLMYLQSTSFKDAVIENGVWNLHLDKNLSYLPKNICFKQFEKKCWKKLDAKKKEIKEEED